MKKKKSPESNVKKNFQYNKRSNSLGRKFDKQTI